MTGANFSSWYRADEGTLYSEASRDFAVPSGQALRVITIGDGSDISTIRHQYSTATGAAFVVASSGVSSANIFISTTDDLRKQASAYKTDDFATSVNASSVATDTSGTIPVVNQIRFGATQAGGAVLGGRIRKFAFYPKALGATELQALTL
jgi:hypothetical protein